MAAEVGEAGLDAASNLLGRPATDRPGGVLARLLGRGQDLGRQLPGHVVDVVAVVAIFGEVAALSNRHDRGAQVLDLAAEVVEVVLALHLVAGRGQHSAEKVAGEGAAGVADVERPRWVGRDELDVDVLRMLGGDVAPGRRVAQDVLDGRGQGAVREADVEEAGWRDIDAGDRRVGVRRRRRDVRGNRFGDLQGGAAVGLGQLEGDVAGEVAILWVGRALDRDWLERLRRGVAAGRGPRPVGPGALAVRVGA